MGQPEFVEKISQPRRESLGLRGPRFIRAGMPATHHHRPYWLSIAATFLKIMTATAPQSHQIIAHGSEILLPTVPANTHDLGKADVGKLTPERSNRDGRGDQRKEK
jgi:hypothetical protein